jgi:CsoR family transcriptional regulator, copper-sensing transcriptional repressor
MKHLHHHNEDIKKRKLHRLKIIQGHLKAIENMISADKYCVDIIHQSMAVQKALKRLDMEMMKDHLHTCVVEQIQGKEQERAVEELLKLYEMK